MSMQPVVFYVKLFSINSPADLAKSRRKLLFMLEALTKCNQEELKDKSKKYPLLYESDIVYQPEFGTEEWQDIPTTVERGFGDCEDLAAYRCAELREIYGIKAMPHIKWRLIDGSWRFHALVQHPDSVEIVNGRQVVIPGRIEDPSLRLGMRKWAQVLSAAVPGEF